MAIVIKAQVELKEGPYSLVLSYDGQEYACTLTIGPETFTIRDTDRLVALVGQITAEKTKLKNAVEKGSTGIA